MYATAKWCVLKQFGILKWRLLELYIYDSIAPVFIDGINNKVSYVLVNGYYGAVCATPHLDHTAFQQNRQNPR